MQSMSAWVIASSRYGLVLRRTMTLTACEVSLILVDAVGQSSIRATDSHPSPATSDRPRLHIGISRRMLANESRRIRQIGFANAISACLLGRVAQKGGTTDRTDIRVQWGFPTVRQVISRTQVWRSRTDCHPSLLIRVIRAIRGSLFARSCGIPRAFARITVQICHIVLALNRSLT